MADRDSGADNPGQTGTTISNQADTASIIALGITCGALFIMTGGFAYAMCRWRLKFLKLHKAGGGDGVMELQPKAKKRQSSNADEPDKEETVASGAL
ncbi:hypothetical protein HIM_02882 [Hirsutella minnesotensis 3608]|nr:hypothetical protein HIM_02882 [Hirsutella minnesotensis 3608]